jgi:hypothetical protein
MKIKMEKKKLKRQRNRLFTRQEGIIISIGRRDGAIERKEREREREVSVLAFSKSILHVALSR